MKKIYLLLLLIVISVLFFFLISKNSFYEFEVNGKKYKLLVAKTQPDWMKGLMFYKNKSELKGADGMIFIFPDKQIRSFWNENTYLNLDIYWFNDEILIGKDYLPSIEKNKDVVTVISPDNVNKVVEIVR